MLAEPTTSAVPELVTLTSIARAVARKDCRAAEALRLASTSTRRHLCLAFGEVSLNFPHEFSDYIRIAKAN